MASKLVDVAVRAPRRGPLLDQDPQRLEEEVARLGGTIEHELEELIARHGPDPERIVALLATRPTWQRRRAELKLRADYGRDAAEILIRSAENGAIYDPAAPAISRLREAARKGGGGHKKLLSETASRRARGEKAELPEDLRERAERLPDDVRSAVERATGESAGDVRMVRGADAAEAARAIDALAFTTSGVIVVDESHLQNPEAGRELLVHEAVHALQQRRSGGESGAAGLSSPAAEREADTIAHAATHGLQMPAAPVREGLGQAQVARKQGDTGSSAGGNSTASVELQFYLGGAQCKVKVDVPQGAKATSGGSANPAVTADVKLDTSKLNALLPQGVKFSDAEVSLKVAGNKINSNFKIAGKYEGKAPYLKPVDFTFDGDTGGHLTGKFKIELDIPGFAQAKSNDLEVKKDGVSGDIQITTDKFKFKGLGNLAVKGSLVAHVKNNNLEKIDGDASITLPSGFGDAKIKCNVSGSKLSEVSADVKTKDIPGVGPINCTLKWSEKGGFELPPPGQKIDVSKIKGLKGSVNLYFSAQSYGYDFTVDAKGVSFTAKPLQKLKVGKIQITDKGLDATVSINGANIDVPGWLHVGQLSGSIEIKGKDLICKDVKSPNVVIGGARGLAGSMTCSYENGDFKAKAKITQVNMAPKLIKVAKPLEADLDLGDGKANASVTGDLQAQLGAWGKGDITGLSLKDGHLTGKGKVTITAPGLLKGATVNLELQNNQPYVKGELDAKNIKKKIELPGKSKIPVDIDVKNVDIKVSSDGDLQGKVDGEIKVDGGKLAQGNFHLEAKNGHIEGDIKGDVKQIPLLKGSGTFTLKYKDGNITGGGDVTLHFEKYIKGAVTVGYHTGSGFAVKGSNLTLDIPGFPFKVDPFDVEYANGKIDVPKMHGTLIPGKVPGVRSAEIGGSFKDNKLELEAKNIQLAIPKLKENNFSVKWSDGKWDVKGEIGLDLGKGFSVKAKLEASKNGGEKLNFNCELDFEASEIKNVIPGVEVQGGKLVIKYTDGHLKFDSAQLKVSIGKGAATGDLKFSFNDGDSTFNADGKVQLALKYLTAASLDVKVEHNELKQISVKDLKLSIPVGQAVLNGTVNLKGGKMSADLKADITGVPLLESAHAEATIVDDKWEKFSAEAHLKKLPGIDLSGVTIGGKIEKDEPAVWAEGPVKIPGVKSDGFKLKLMLSPSTWEAGVSGSMEIPALGKATVSIDMKSEGSYSGKLEVQPHNPIIKSVTGWVKYDKGKGFTFGGGITLVIAKIFEGEVDFEKLTDGDFELKGAVRPTKAIAGGGGKKKLIGAGIGINQNIPLFGIPYLADIHAFFGVNGTAEAGIVMPEFSLLQATVSGKLSELEKGDLPDSAKIQVKVSAGAYAGAGGNLQAGVGASVLLASLNLTGGVGVGVTASAEVAAEPFLEKKGNEWSVGADFVAHAGAQANAHLGLGLNIELGPVNVWSTELAGFDIPLGQVDIGTLDLTHFEYKLGSGDYHPSLSLPHIDFAKLTGPIKDGISSSWSSVSEEAKQKIEVVKNALEKAGKLVIEGGKAVVHGVEAGAHLAYEGGKAVVHGVEDAAGWIDKHAPWHIHGIPI